jgi:hypothetical protein
MALRSDITLARADLRPAAWRGVRPAEGRQRRIEPPAVVLLVELAEELGLHLWRDLRGLDGRVRGTPQRLADILVPGSAIHDGAARQRFDHRPPPLGPRARGRLEDEAPAFQLQIHFVDEFDAHASPLGAKGIGEVGATGVAAAVANAVFHAAGRRVRELPITPDKLL